MKRALKRIVENGKPVWSVSGDGGAVKNPCAPCNAMRKAKEKAERVTAEIRAEKNKESAAKAEGDRK